ncbi:MULTISPECIES: DUF559 domain-containing protein [Methylocaldum]|jgi:very-short-patch-repair endonuclease|uniref:endonuclease domain-containing protein n=1 Tax=unclassified Methylocaldum TaxID=2622260 RepID=UPI0012EBC9C4|nr:DUF559 domain-containing protein [Methylocaldum sp. BRCS4]
MLTYNSGLKQYSRRLRKGMTDAEQKLWRHLRGKQIGNAQFYRQKPIGNFIVDFYSSKAGLVIEVDGAQHLGVDYRNKDAHRDAYLNGLGLKVLRFNDLQVLLELDAVLEAIHREVMERIRGNPP